MSTLNRTFVLSGDGPAQSLWAFLKANWRAMHDAGKSLAVTVTEHQSKRSVEQNARLHAILSDIARNAWVNGRQFDMETWKEFYRRKFIGTEEIEMPDGARTERGISTTTLGVGDFASFMTQIECHAAQDLGVEFR